FASAPRLITRRKRTSLYSSMRRAATPPKIMARWSRKSSSVWADREGKAMRRLGARATRPPVLRMRGDAGKLPALPGTYLLPCRQMILDKGFGFGFDDLT